jgi:hypothetical protein
MTRDLPPAEGGKHKRKASGRATRARILDKPSAIAHKIAPWIEAKRDW